MRKWQHSYICGCKYESTSDSFSLHCLPANRDDQIQYEKEIASSVCGGSHSLSNRQKLDFPVSSSQTSSEAGLYGVSAEENG